MDSTTTVARQMWTLFEPVHVLTYFSAESRAAFEDAGLRGFWRGYFAGRASPLGATGPGPVTASFFGFAAPMVARAVPGIWQLISPAEALAVRSAGAVTALRRLAGPLSASVPEAAGLLGRAIAGLDCAGRVLASANAALPAAGEPAQLWQAATVLREHRGDGHVAALVAAGVDGCEALALRAGLDLSRELLQPIRGWSDAQWDQAVARLASRGWLEPGGRATPAGAAAHQAIEDATDLAAARPWEQLGPAGTGRLAELLLPIARACAAELPFPNPIGLPVPEAGAAPGPARQ
jgi:hypothetical protein